VDKVEISQKAENFIWAQEVGSEAYYDRTELHFDWPGLGSGPTIAGFYDLGYVTRTELVDDWTGILSDNTIMLLINGIGLTGERAHMFVSAHHSEVTITYQQALTEFRANEMPKWETKMRKSLPNFDLLSPDCAGALVSLGFNRGTGGFHSTLPRYAEMANIHDLMAQGKWALIPEQIAKMARLWPNTVDLRRRRALEAQLFAGGVADCKPLVVSPQPSGPGTMPGNQTEQPAHPAPAPPEEPSVSTPAGSTPGVLDEIEAALQAAENELPQLLSVLSIFIPGLKALTPFLGLLPVAIEAVDAINKATGMGQHAAIAGVVQTLTPGQPGAAALN
jgi:GH24 family phage-related lysozyme (muramidase)